MLLFSIPSLAESAIICLYCIFAVVAVIFVLKIEKKSIWRFFLSLLCIILPLFSVAYLIYALTKEKETKA